jgi:uncharacterized protein (DUF1800 family)
MDAEILRLEGLIRSHDGTVNDLRAWHGLTAISAERQLLEIMGQFINNHFVTYVWKSRNWLDDDGGLSRSEAERLAANMEYRELMRWKEILLDPHGTFLDLLTASIESPAMIIYLDTIENGKEQPNENYGRELMELFCMGVDNGYDQDDIEEMARVWTGWRIIEAHPDDLQPIPDPYVQSALLNTGSVDWLYLKGVAEPEADWNQLSYETDGKGWLNGQTGIGYGDGDDTTVLDDMRNQYTSLYFRHVLAVPVASEVKELTIRIFIDDGYIAYLNGVEIGRHFAGNEGQVFAFDDTATDFESNGSWTTILIDNEARSLLADGDNLLAVHGLNGSRGSSDFSFEVEILEGPKPVYRAYFDSTDHDEEEKVLFPERKVDARFGEPYAGMDYELTIPATPGGDGRLEGYTTIAHLANLPHTMEFISSKLCRLFVHEDFDIGYYYNLSEISDEAALIRACMAAWDTPASDGRKGNIRNVLRVIFESDLFRSQQAARHKVKTPFEYTVSAIRALRADLGVNGFSASTDGYDLINPMDRLGMELFARSQPNGWPEDGSEWVDTGTIAERLRFTQNLLMPASNPEKQSDFGSSSVDNVCDPLALLSERLTVAEQREAPAVVDFFLELLFPAVGTGNLSLEREECFRLLNSDESGTPDSSMFSTLALGSAAYEERVRSLVSLLLCSPKFNEQ